MLFCSVVFFQVMWLQHKVMSNMASTSQSTQKANAAHKKIKYIVYIHSRPLAMEDNVLASIQDFSKKCNYQVIIHSDINLPSVREQVLIFSRASIVIGSHGAGLLFMVLLLHT